MVPSLSLSYIAKSVLYGLVDLSVPITRNRRKMKQIWKWVVIVVLTYFAGLATLSWYYFDTTPITIKPATTNYYITANYFNSEEVLTYTLP
jgi:hypothetical protein